MGARWRNPPGGVNPLPHRPPKPLGSAHERAPPRLPDPPQPGGPAPHPAGRPRQRGRRAGRDPPPRPAGTGHETNFEDKLKKRTQTSGCAQGTAFGDLMEALETVRLPAAPLRTSWLYRLTHAVNTTPSLY